MKTIKPIKQLVEIIAISQDESNKGIETNYLEIVNAVKDKFLPFLQFNIDGTSTESAQELFNRISENTQKACSVPFLPDGRNTTDKIGDILIETPTIIEWQGGKAGKNIVINYANKSSEEGQACLNQLILICYYPFQGIAISYILLISLFLLKRLFYRRIWITDYSIKLLAAQAIGNT